MIYVFESGSIVYDGSTITEKQKQKAVAIETLPIAENREGFYAQVKANIETSEIYFEYFEIVEEAEENPNPVSLADLKQLKRTEIEDACNLSISYAFQSDVKNGMQPYHLTEDVQKEINANFILASQGKSVPFKNANQQICEAWTAQEFLAFYEQGINYATSVKFYKDGIMRMIELCETVSGLNKIAWGIQLPADIQVEIDVVLDQLQGV